MDRRVFLGTLAGGLFAVPFAAEPQQSKKVYRIGVIDPGPPNFYERRGSRLLFFQELRQAGLVVGQDTMFEVRPLGRPDQLQASVDELVALRVDLIMAGGTPAALTAKRSTSTIPVLFYNVADPVGSGLVTTWSRPGGNATGITHVSKELMAKRVELLKQVLPSASRVAIFAGPSSSITLTDTERAVRAGGLAVTTVLAADPSEFEGAFARMAKERVGAVIVLPRSRSSGGRFRGGAGSRSSIGAPAVASRGAISTCAAWSSGVWSTIKGHSARRVRACDGLLKGGTSASCTVRFGLGWDSNPPIGFRFRVIPGILGRSLIRG